MRGHRKLIVFFGAATFLLAGLLFCLAWEGAGAVVFSPYATAIVTLATAVVLGNVGEHLAKKGTP